MIDQAVVRAHLLGELRECGGAATTKQLADQTPDPWWPERAAEYGYVYAHLRALESAGLVRRAADRATRGMSWRLVEGDHTRLRTEPARRG